MALNFLTPASPWLASRRVVGFGTALLIGCGPPPSWQQLLASKISEHYPAYTVLKLPDGNVQVTRPGLAEQRINVQEIADFCQRGPKDCNYASDQMLLNLAP
jgi:hypothetical protein